jgi:Mn-containing catalase
LSNRARDSKLIFGGAEGELNNAAQFFIKRFIIFKDLILSSSCGFIANSLS